MGSRRVRLPRATNEQIIAVDGDIGTIDRRSDHINFNRKMFKLSANGVGALCTLVALMPFCEIGIGRFLVLGPVS